MTANLSGPSQSPDGWPELLDWTRRRIVSAGADRPALIFAQETFPEWLDLFDEHSGYQVIFIAEPRGRVR